MIDISVDDTGRWVATDGEYTGMSGSPNAALRELLKQIQPALEEITFFVDPQGDGTYSATAVHKASGTELFTAKAETAEAALRVCRNSINVY